MDNGNGRSWPPRWRIFALHVFALSGLVVAQPVYYWLSRQPEFLVAHGVGALEAVLLVVLLSFVFPVLLLVVVMVWRILGPRALLACQVFSIGVLVGLFGLHAVPVTSGWALWVVFSVFMIAGLAFYWRQAFFRRLLSYAVVPAIIFPFVFLLADPVRSLAFAGQARAMDVAGLGGGTEQEQEKALSSPVLLVIFDELAMSSLENAEGEINQELFPNFARLADTSVWFPRAATIYKGTPPSIIALMTGSIPDTTLSRNAHWNQYPKNLFTWASALYGGNVDANELWTNLCPPLICPPQPASQYLLLTADVVVLTLYAVLPDPLGKRFLPNIDDQLKGFVNLPIAAALLGISFDIDWAAMWNDFVDDLDRRANGFYFEHAALPHTPLQYLADGSEYPSPLRERGYNRGLRHPEAMLNNLELKRYLEQVRYVDVQLGKLMDELQALGLWEDTLLIVLSDHGRSFREGSHWRIPDGQNLGEVMNVPLFIKLPGQNQGRMDDYPASIIDIAPTIADLLGKELGWPTDGVALLGEDRPARESLPILCVRRTDCSAEFREKAGSDGILRLRVGEFDRYRDNAAKWVRQHSHYSAEADMVQPNVSESRLLGRSTSQFEIRSPADGQQLTLFNSQRLNDVSIKGDMLPTLVAGYVHNVPLREDEYLVVGLNGVLAGVAEVDERDGREVFAALLNPETFVEGDNHIEAFRVQWKDGEPEGLIELKVGDD